MQAGPGGGGRYIIHTVCICIYPVLYSEKYRSGPRGRKDSDTSGKIYVCSLSVYSGTRAMDRDSGTVDAAELKVQMSLRSEHGKEEIGRDCRG